MKSTLLKLLPITTAVLALSFASGVWADDTQTETTTTSDTSNTFLNINKNLTHNVTDNITVSGNINVGSQATSLAKSVQELENSLERTVDGRNGLSQSDIADNVFQDGRGNANVNVGAGVHYLQDNVMALSSIGSAQNTTSLDAEAFNMQKIENHAPIQTYRNIAPVHDNSFIKDNAFSGFSGNANVNVGSGDMYEQSNDVALSEGAGTSVIATASGNQVVNNPEVGPFVGIEVHGVLDNQAGVLGNAFSGASGLLNTNVGSGISYGQNINVAVAAAHF